MVQVTNVADVTDALFRALSSDLTLTNEGVAITRSGEVNEDPARCPWIGVYRMSQRFEPRAAASMMRKQSIDLMLLVQQADGTNGEECEASLERLVANVLNVVLSDTTVGGTVAFMPDVQVGYTDYTMIEEQFMQTAAIYITVETITGG